MADQTTPIFPNLGTLHIQVQIGASAPSGNPSAESDLMTGCEVLGAEIEEGLDNWATYNILVSASDQKFFDKILQKVTLVNSPVWVRMGLAAVDSPIFRPWERFILTNIKATAPNVGSQRTVLIELADCLYGFYNQATKSWKGPISKTVQSVLQGSGQTQPTFKVVTESTKGEFTLFQSFQSDWEFIQKRLQIRAANQQGSGGYHIWAREGNVIFATASFKDFQPKAYSIAAGSPSSYTSIAFEDSSKLYGPRGGAGQANIPVSPLSRASGVLGSDPSKVLSMGQSSAAFPASDTNFTARHTGDNDPSEIQYQAQAKFAWQKEQYYSIHFTMTQQPLVRVGDYISVPNTTDFGLYSGVWWVRSLNHRVQRGSMTTNLVATRGQLVPDGTSSDVMNAGGQPIAPQAQASAGIPFQLPQSPPSAQPSQPGQSVPVSDPSSGFNIRTGSPTSTTPFDTSLPDPGF